MVQLAPYAIKFRAAEAMNSMDTDVMNRTGDLMSIDSSEEDPSKSKLPQDEDELEMRDLPKYLLAKSYFDCKEYERSACALKGCQSLKSQFLRLYSKFLVIDLVSGFNCSLERNAEMMVRKYWVYCILW
jgi:hypothetical protein